MLYKSLNLSCFSDTILGTEKSQGKEVRTDTEKVSGHVSDLVVGPGIVIIEGIGTTEIGIGIWTETGNEREIGT